MIKQLFLFSIVFFSTAPTIASAPQPPHIHPKDRKSATEYADHKAMLITLCLQRANIAQRSPSAAVIVVALHDQLDRYKQMPNIYRDDILILREMLAEYKYKEQTNQQK
jgi:hypothetical protein